VTDALLRAATARSAGRLETLDVTGCARVTHAALLAAVTANSGTLRELQMRGATRTDTTVAQAEALLRAAPGLRACHAGVQTSEVPVARAMLRADLPFAALRLHRLRVRAATFPFAEHAVLALVADLPTCTSIREFELVTALLNGPAALDALVDAAVACRLRALRLIDCTLDAASAPALARLLGGGALAELDISGRGEPFLDAPAAAVLANALRACSTLTALMLRHVSFWDDPGVATVLLGALTGHASLRTLVLSHNLINDANPAAVSAALGALVAANAPALQEVKLHNCGLSDSELRPLFDALPGNTHLRTLNCNVNKLTNAFACNALLPAVRANGSLRLLSCTLQRNVSAAGKQALAEAEALVAQRAADQ
jgi:hypothetical protein